jgi:hypothetical protein
MCDFDLERRKDKEHRMEGEGRPKGTAKYLLDWVVRVAVIVSTVLVTATFAHVRAIGVRSVALEIRMSALERDGASHLTQSDEVEFWKAIAERPTREELRTDLEDIKQMIRDLRAEIHSQ